MGWLVVEDRVLATVEVVDTARARARGLIGRESLEGALLLTPARGVHTVGVRWAIDVAFCDRDLRVLDVVTMPPNRIGRPRIRARTVIEAPKGSFERWGLRVGDVVELRR